MMKIIDFYFYLFLIIVLKVLLFTLRYSYLADGKVSYKICNRFLGWWQSILTIGLVSVRANLG